MKNSIEIKLNLVGTVFARTGADEYCHVYCQGLTIEQDDGYYMGWDETGQRMRFSKNDWKFKPVS